MKKLGPVLISSLALACAVIAPAALGSAHVAKHRHHAAGPAVSVTVKSMTKTLLPSTTAHRKSGWITKGGTPSGKCPGASAAGALDVATHGRWTGKYYSSVGGIFITSILGVKPSGSEYWSLYVDGKASSKGACAVTLKAGLRLLFKIVK